LSRYSNIEVVRERKYGPPGIDITGDPLTIYERITGEPFSIDNIYNADLVLQFISGRTFKVVKDRHGDPDRTVELAEEEAFMVLL
jgi:hypothetical protein